MSHETFDTAPGELELLRSLKSRMRKAVEESPCDIVDLRELLVLLARTHFSTSDHYGKYQELLKDLVYDTEDPDKGQLAVEASFVFNPKTKSSRPAVYVSVKGCKFQKLGLGNYGGVSPDNATVYQIKNTTCEVRIICVHSSADIAFIMAETALACFMGLREELMCTLGLDSLEVEAISDIEEESKRPEGYFRTDLIMSLQMPLQIATITESHRLKKIAIITEITA